MSTKTVMQFVMGCVVAMLIFVLGSSISQQTQASGQTAPKVYEHKTIFSDGLPSAKQLNEFSRSGWNVFFILHGSARLDHQRLVLYMRRIKVST